VRQPLLSEAMNFLPQAIRRMARDSVTQPLAVPVASNAAAYLEEVGERKLGWRAARRELVYRLSGQERYRIDHLREGCRRGLWMYFGVPQIGDALMDLAPRSMFAEAGVEVDLVSHAHLTELFRGDPWFARVLADPSQIDGAAYDFVLVPSHKHRSLKMKQRHLPRHPWFSVHARFTGPEFHRAEFAARRLADFLRLAPAPEAIARHARQKLGGAGPSGRAPGAIALALGGVRANRTYSHWPEVVRALAQAGYRDFVLLGSENGSAAARDIAALGDSSLRVLDFVGRTSLGACRELLSRCALALAADGGLMHLAIAAGVPVVSLFQSDVRPQWRLPPDEIAHSIQSATSSVSDIAPRLIVQEAQELVSL
jgi:Glycosyltransferase family 9 (heptosyltransferase)